LPELLQMHQLPHNGDEPERSARAFGRERWADPPRPDSLTKPDNTVSSIARLTGRRHRLQVRPEVTTGRVAAALPPGQE